MNYTGNIIAGTCCLLAVGFSIATIDRLNEHQIERQIKEIELKVRPMKRFSPCKHPKIGELQGFLACHNRVSKKRFDI